VRCSRADRLQMMHLLCYNVGLWIAEISLGCFVVVVVACSAKSGERLLDKLALRADSVRPMNNPTHEACLRQPCFSRAAFSRILRHVTYILLAGVARCVWCSNTVSTKHARHICTMRKTMTGRSPCNCCLMWMWRVRANRARQIGVVGASCV
jgi:hypothetical protein